MNWIIDEPPASDPFEIIGTYYPRQPTEHNRVRLSHPMGELESDIDLNVTIPQSQLGILLDTQDMIRSREQRAAKKAHAKKAPHKCSRREQASAFCPTAPSQR